MTNHITNNGGEQNIAIGKNAIGKQVNNYGAPPELLAKYAEELGETKQVIRSFLNTLLEHEVPRDQWDSKLGEIAKEYKELRARVGDDQAAKQAIEAGDYAKAEALLEDAAKQHSLAAAEAHADNARLQRIQLRYAKAAAYWQKAAALLPDDKKKERSLYLHEAGYDFHRVARYSEALPLYEQSLRIRQEIGDKAGEGTTLNNISLIYKARGDYPTALKYLEQSLRIRQEIGDKAGEAVTSWNIGLAYKDQGDLRKAEPYMSRTVQLDEEIGHPDLEKDRAALARLRAQLKAR